MYKKKIVIIILATIFVSYQISLNVDCIYNNFSNIIALVKTKENTEDEKGLLLLSSKNKIRKKLTKSESLASLTDKLDMARPLIFSMPKFDKFFATQGMCVAEDYLIVSVYKGDKLTDINRLYVIDINKNTIVSYTSAITGHMNGMCYDATNKLVCVSGDFIGENALRRFKLSPKGKLMYYDKISIPNFYAFAYGWNKGSYYIFSNDVVYVTEDFKSYNKKIPIHHGDLKLHKDIYIQGMCVDDNFMYICFSGSDNIEQIHICDKETGETLKVLTYPREIYGELEDIDIYNDYLFININRPPVNKMLGVHKVPLFINTKK